MTDFVVIGGGIAGVSAAAHLAPHGRVALLEMERDLAYHTTGRSAAMLVENYGSEGSRLLVKAARPFLESPPPGSVDGELLSPRPVMWVASRDDLADLREKASATAGQGANNSFLSAEEAVELVPMLRPSWLGGGLLEPSGADIDVAALHQAFVRIARSHDADIITSATVTAISRTQKGWSVEHARGVHRAPVVVNASGAWGDGVAEMAGIAPIGLTPFRRTAFMVPGSSAYATLPMIVETRERWYLRPDGEQILCSLAEETPSMPEDAKPRMEDVALAIDRINEATTLGIRTVNSEWAGLRTFAPDRDLVIGEDPTAPGFFWLVGQGGIGIQTSPAYGALLAALVLDHPLSGALSDAGVDPARTSPARFR